jgi:predicted dehydrogenase
MEAGVHVLCEKPFAISLAEVDAMMEASRRTGRVLAEAFMYRHHPQTKLMGEYVRQGRLGEISVVRGAFNFDLGGDRENVRMVPAYGGGSLWDLGCYPMSFAQFVMGGIPERVSAMQWVGPTGIDESFVGQMSYSGARLAQITCSFRTPFFSRAEVIGTQGRLVLNHPFIGMDESGGMFFYPPEEDPVEVEVPEKELYLGEVEDMHRAILDREPNYLTLAESRDHVRTLLALYEAARIGQTVPLT